MIIKIPLYPLIFFLTVAGCFLVYKGCFNFTRRWDEELKINAHIVSASEIIIGLIALLVAISLP